MAQQRRRVGPPSAVAGSGGARPVVNALSTSPAEPRFTRPIRERRDGHE